MEIFPKERLDVNKFQRIFSAITLAVAAFLVLEKPAFADGFIFWGYFGTNAPLFLGLATKGIALAVVILIEMAVFARVWRIPWLKALLASIILNIISSIAGAVVGGIYYMGTSCSIILLIVFLILLVAAIAMKSFPWWFTAIAFYTLAMGTYISGINMDAVSPLSIWDGIAALIFPLLAGFGLTLFVEGWSAGLFKTGRNRWRGLMLANVLSYIFLALMVLFVGPNPYDYANTGMDSRDLLEYQLIESGSPGPFGRPWFQPFPTDPLLSTIRYNRVPNHSLLSYLMYKPPRNYDADYELKLLMDVYLSSGKYVDPRYGKAIIDDTLTIPTLRSAARNQLEWWRDYFSFRIRAVEAVKANDQEALNNVYSEWISWHSANPKPGMPSDWKFDDPKIAVRYANEYFKSDLKVPEAKAENE